MWIFNGKKKAKQDRDETRRVKVAASQLALLEAATTTADAAQHVTNRLRQHLSDSIRQFESTARLISDALIVCDKNGKIQAFNPAAENIFATTASNISQTSITNLFQLNNAKIDAETLWNAIE
jgi:PAS domain-containing protein